MTSRTKTSMPLLLWLDRREGATCLRLMAKDWRAREEGANWTVFGARAEDFVTGTIDQLMASGVGVGAQGAMAMWTKGRGGGWWSSSSWALW